jgi:hypothetical protein
VVSEQIYIVFGIKDYDLIHISNCPEPFLVIEKILMPLVP